MGIILTILGAVLIAVYLLPIIRQVFNFGSIAGIGVGALILVFGLTWNRLSFTQQKYVAFGVFVVLILIGSLSSFVLRDGKTNADG